MIGYLKGTLLIVLPDRCLLEVHTPTSGIGYWVGLGTAHAQTLHKGEQTALWILSRVHDGETFLLGVRSYEEYEWLVLLLRVPGVGGRVAQNILSLFYPDTLQNILKRKDVSLLKTADGVGPKLAQRIVHELYDKCDFLINTLSDDRDSMREDTILALQALGYSLSHAHDTYQRAMEIHPTFTRFSCQERITACLQILS